MFKRFINKFFGCNKEVVLVGDWLKEISIQNEQIHTELNKLKTIATTQNQIKAILKEHAKTSNCNYLRDALNPAEKLTVRERLALDYAKEIFNWRVLDYPEKLKIKDVFIGGREKTMQQHYKDAARESLFYADEIIKKSNETKNH